MDREVYENMVAEFRLDQESLRENIRQELAKKYEGTKRRKEQAHTTRMLDATHSPVFDQPDRRKAVVEQTHEGIEKERFSQRYEEHTEFKEIFAQRNMMLERAAFRGFGDSPDGALKLVDQQQKQNEASGNLNKEWSSERETQARYEASNDLNKEWESEKETQTRYESENRSTGRDHSASESIGKDFGRAIEPGGGNDGGREH